MRSLFWILPALILVLGVPFLLRTELEFIRSTDDTVVIITPHPESVRQEFRQAFRDWYQDRSGRSVRVDYRVIGGTSEISRFLGSEFTNAFRNHWESERGRTWTHEVRYAFNDPAIALPDIRLRDDLRQQARRAFLESDVSAGIDVFFGGGSYEHSQHAEAGHLVDAGLLERFPQWFSGEHRSGSLPPAIPQRFAGESFYDPEGRWYGAVLASYGIIYNRDSLERLGIEHPPRQWSDLADPRYFGEIAVSDPTQSGAMTQAFEMILQQQMQQGLQRLITETGGSTGEANEDRAVAEGWLRGMQLIQRISANARYFTDSSTKPNIDVSLGDCAAGMTIDFYGRFQQETVLGRSGDTRFVYHSPEGGSTVSADPISLLRGAPNEEVARAFIEFVLSEEGQKLWNFETGTPGGPQTYALRRPPIRPDAYRQEWQQYRSDPDYNPYLAIGDFHYRGDWTGRLFGEIRFLIRTCFMDARQELAGAWNAIRQARAEGRHDDADRAEAVFGDLSRIDYATTSESIRSRMRRSKLDEVQLARELNLHFRAQYREARRLADGDE